MYSNPSQSSTRKHDLRLSDGADSIVPGRRTSEVCANGLHLVGGPCVKKWATTYDREWSPGRSDAAEVASVVRINPFRTLPGVLGACDDSIAGAILLPILRIIIDRVHSFLHSAFS